MFRLFLPLFAIAVLAGCDAEIKRFRPNQVYALSLAHSRVVGTEMAVRDVDQVVESVFGTPQRPRWPSELLPKSLAGIVDADRLSRAAGAVSSDKQGTHRGLYTEHCVTCHGVEGSGAGPAALLQNPYPRDFRAGIYKWKSTVRAAKPTRNDLLKLLQRGVPGTGMPSFALIEAEDREALVDYVIYLSVRGEVERDLLDLCVDEFGYQDDDPLADDERLTWTGSDDSPNSQTITQAIQGVVESWQQADANIAPVASPADEKADSASIKRGRDLFHAQIANCVGCHGTDGNGQVVTLDYDDWTKEFSTRIGLTPSKREDMKPFRKAGGLRPRQIHPRNLQDGVFRGGGDDETLYRRISQGIAGTPMPGVEISKQDSGTGLTSEQVWDLVYYLRSLGQDASTLAATPSDH